MTGVLERPDTAAAPVPVELGRRGFWSRVRVDLRLARRQALKGWTSSVLVVALIALPMTLVTGGIVFGVSHIGTTDEKLTAEVGHAQAWVAVVDVPNDSRRQYFNEPTWYEQDPWQEGDPEPPARHESAAPLLAGLDPIEIGLGSVTAETAGGIGALSAVIGDAGAPVLRGRFELVEGRVPAADDEVMVSPGALTRLGARVGGELELTEPVGRYTITGVMTRAEDADAAEVVFLPGTPENRALQADLSSTRWYVPQWHPTAEDVFALNREGLVVLDRDLYAHPGAYAAPDWATDGLSWMIAFLVGVGGAFSAYLVVMLAGAAFSVSARRQQRALAVAASVGATRASVFRIVLLQGTVLGLVGGVVGAAVGVGLGILFLHVLDDGAASSFWGVHVPWWGIAGVVLFAVVVGTAAALVPARSATKGEVIQALRGARRPVSVSAKRPLWGILLMGLGVAVTVAAGVGLAALNAQRVIDYSSPLRTVCTLGFIAGPVLLQIGVIFAGHWILAALARLVSRLGLAPRIASRDAAANPGRIVPAFAAIAAVAFLSSAGLSAVGVGMGAQAREWYYDAPVGGVVVHGWIQAGTPTETVADIEARVREVVDRSDPVAVGSVRLQGGGQYDEQGRLLNRDATFASPQLQSYRHCPNGAGCTTKAEAAIGNGWSLGVVAPEGLAAVLGVPVSDAALAEYGEGMPLVLDRGLLTRDGEIVINTVAFGELDDYYAKYPDRSDEDVDFTSHTVRPIVIDLGVRRAQSVLISPAAARALGIAAADPGSMTDWQLIADYDTAITTAAMDRLQSELSYNRLPLDGASLWAEPENGPPDPGPWVWLIVAATSVLVVGAAAVSLGLARVERRPDDATLAAVGGSRTLRRNIAFWQALTIAGVGAVTGAAAGLLPVWGVVISAAGGNNPATMVDVPWLALIGLAAVLPLAIAAVSWLVPPRDPDLTRRTAIA